MEANSGSVLAGIPERARRQSDDEANSPTRRPPEECVAAGETIVRLEFVQPFAAKKSRVLASPCESLASSLRTVSTV
jgi:hypothetical protein